jgi:hypothetical protein
MSTTCNNKSASRTSSRVLLKESTSCVGNFDETYRIRKQERQVLMTTFRTVVSKWRKACFRQNITFPDGIH